MTPVPFFSPRPLFFFFPFFSFFSSRVRVESFPFSLDGYRAGPDQSARNTLGVGGEALHDWIVSTRSWRQMHGKEGGATGIDDDFAARQVAQVAVRGYLRAAGTRG